MTDLTTRRISTKEQKKFLVESYRKGLVGQFLTRVRKTRVNKKKYILIGCWCVVLTTISKIKKKITG